jgi:hypothetical protein
MVWEFPKKILDRFLSVFIGVIPAGPKPARDWASVLPGPSPVLTVGIYTSPALTVKAAHLRSPFREISGLEQQILNHDTFTITKVKSSFKLSLPK